MASKSAELNLLRHLADTATEGVCITDENDVILYLNEAARQLTTAIKVFVGKGEKEIFGEPGVSEMCRNSWETVTFRKITPDGRKLFVSAHPVKGERNSLQFTVMFLNEKKREESPADMDENLLFVYKGRGMSYMLNLADKLASIDNPVTILGESGSGKVMLAQYIHRKSSHNGGAFVCLNCASVPEEMLEEELFGRSVVGGRPGMLTLAAGGTLFIDEVDALPFYLQTKLLYALHDRVYRTVDDPKGIPLDCRIIAASNNDLRNMVDEGTFRKDLFYLIDVFEVRIPALRERPMDIIPLIRYLTERYNRRYNCNRRISDEALAILTDYGWPGNLREIDSTLERLVAMAPEDIIEAYHLPDRIRFQVMAERNHKKNGGTLEEALEEVEKTIILRAYRESGSSYEVAKTLKISQSKASRLIRKYRP